jgi:hypothetical protein
MITEAGWCRAISAEVAPAAPAPKRNVLLMPIRRRALTLLGGSPSGLPVSLLVHAHKVPLEVLLELVRSLVCDRAR